MENLNFKKMTAEELVKLKNDLEEEFTVRSKEIKKEAEKKMKQKLESKEVKELKKNLQSALDGCKKLNKKFKVNLTLPLALEIEINDEVNSWLVNNNYNEVYDYYCWSISAKLNDKTLPEKRRKDLESYIADYINQDVCYEGLKLLAPEVVEKLQQAIDNFVKYKMQIDELDVPINCLNLKC